MAVRKKLFLFEILFKKIDINADILLKTFTFDPDVLREIPVTAKVRFLGQDEFQVNFLGTLFRGGKAGEGDYFEESKPIEDPNDDCAPSGKSCLFPMETLSLAEQIKKTPVSVEIYTQTDKDMTPVFLGHVKLPFGLHFIDVIVSSSRAHDLPVSAFSRSTTALTNIFGEVCGCIDVYFRISCFGSAIMSDFDFLKPVVEVVETSFETQEHKLDEIDSHKPQLPFKKR